MPIRVVLATWMLTATCLAADWQPVAVVSFAGWNELDADLALLGELIQAPDLSPTLGKALAKRTDVKDLAGLDGRRPWGAAVQTDGLRIASVAFVPVSDPAPLLKALTPLVGEPQSVAPDVWKIGRQTLTGFVRYREGWLYVSQTREDLEALPDPQALLGDLTSRYELAVTLYPAHLPEALRTLAIDHVREERQVLLARDAEAAKLALSPALASLTYDAVEEFFTDVRQLTLGWTLDRQRKLAAFEVLVTPIPAGRVARRWEAQRWATSALGSVAQASSTWLDVGVAVQRENNPQHPALSTEYSVLSTQYVESLLNRADCFTPIQRKVAISCVQAINGLLANAAGAPRTEMALRVQGKNPPYVIVAAARTNEANIVERTLNALAEAANVDGSFLRVKLDVARQGPLRVHALELIGTNDLEPLQKLFGDEATVYIATTGQYVIMAYGHRAMTALEKSLPKAEQHTPAIQMSVHLGAVLAALARSTSNPEGVPLLTLMALSLQASDDRLLFTAETRKEGLKARLEFREGVLRGAALGLNLAAQRMLHESRRDSPIPPARTP
jgi:hypothetical protein